MTNGNFCPNCGHKISGNPLFCPNCGYKLQNNTQHFQNSQHINQNSLHIPSTPRRPISNHPKRHFNKKSIVLICVVIVLLVGGIGVYHHHESNVNDPQTSQQSNSNQSDQSNHPNMSHKQMIAKYMNDVWSVVQNSIPSSGGSGGPDNFTHIASDFQGGSNNKSYKAMNGWIKDMNHKPNGNVINTDLSLKHENIQAVGSHYHIAMQIHYNFYFSSDGKERSQTFTWYGVLDKPYWSKTNTGSGSGINSKIISFKADNKHPINH